MRNTYIDIYTHPWYSTPMKKDLLKEIADNGGSVIVCSDGEGTYTWVATDLESARDFIKRNLEQIYKIKDADVSKIWRDGEWTAFGDVLFMVDIMDVV